MKALVFSDTHFHSFREFSEVNEEGINSRLAEQLLCLDTITALAEANKPDVIFFTGDLWHLKNALDSKVIKLVAERIWRLSQKAVRGLWMVAGNHDYIKWDRDASLLEVLGNLADVSMALYANQPEDFVRIDDWQIVIAPYARKAEETVAWLKSLAVQDRSIFLGHQDLIGSCYGGIVNEKGLAPDVLAAKFKWSFVGHFHESKAVRPNVISVGAPLQLSFSAMGEAVGCWLLDTEAAEPLTFIANEESPQFLELALEPGQAIEFSDDNNYYRIKVKGVVMPEGIGNLKWHRVSFEGVREGLARERSEIKFSDSAVSLIEKYVKARNINALDEEKLKAVGARYL